MGVLNILFVKGSDKFTGKKFCRNIFVKIEKKNPWSQPLAKKASCNDQIESKLSSLMRTC